MTCTTSVVEENKVKQETNVSSIYLEYFKLTVRMSDIKLHNMCTISKKK